MPETMSTARVFTRELPGGSIDDMKTGVNFCWQKILLAKMMNFPSLASYYEFFCPVKDFRFKRIFCQFHYHLKTLKFIRFKLL